jgi:uncharacterized membrane protein
MKSLADIIAWIVAGLATILAIWQVAKFVTAKDASGIPDMMAGVQHLWWAIGAGIVAIACIVIVFVRHPRVEEEIHVTR